MNVSKVILPIGSCHCLANKAKRLIWLHLEKRNSDSDKWARKTDDNSSQVCSTQYRGGYYEHFQEQNETQKFVAHRKLNGSTLSTAILQPIERTRPRRFTEVRFLALVPSVINPVVTVVPISMVMTPSPIAWPPGVISPAAPIPRAMDV